MIIKLPFKKNPKYDNYNFTLKNPIDYRYLSFNHLTILKKLWTIQKPFNKIQNNLNDFKINLHILNIKFLSFCECKEIKKQDKIRLSFALE